MGGRKDEKSSRGDAQDAMRTVTSEAETWKARRCEVRRRESALNLSLTRSHSCSDSLRVSLLPTIPLFSPHSAVRSPQSALAQSSSNIENFRNLSHHWHLCELQKLCLRSAGRIAAALASQPVKRRRTSPYPATPSRRLSGEQRKHFHRSNHPATLPP